jgi:hypothetical protein
MNSPTQYSNTRLLLMFSFGTGLSIKTLKIIFNIFTIITLAYVTIFFIGLLDFVLGSIYIYIQAILLLIVFGLHYPVFLLGMLCTIIDQRLNLSYKVLVLMQILFIIDLVIILIEAGFFIYEMIVFYEFYNDPEWVTANLLFFSYIIPIAISTICYYLFFKKTAETRATLPPVNTTTPATAGAYIPPTTSNTTIIHVPERIALKHPEDIAFAKTAQGSVVNGAVLPSGIAVPAQLNGKNWKLMGNEVVLV